MSIAPRAEVAELAGQGEGRRCAQRLVGREVVGGHVGHVHQPGQAGQAALAGHLGHDRPHELLLAADAAEVGVDVPGPHEGQRLHPVHLVAAGGHVQVGVAVVQAAAAAVAEGDAAEGVDHLQEAGEVDLGVVVDGQPGRLPNGPDQEAGAAEGEGGVDLGGAAVDGGPQVPRQRQHHRPVPVGAEVQDHDGVGAPAGHLHGLDAAELAAAQAVAGVGADQQDVHGLPAGQRGQVGHRPLALGDQAVGVPVGVQRDRPGQPDHERDQDGQGAEQVAAAARAHALRSVTFGRAPAARRGNLA